MNQKILILIASIFFSAPALCMEKTIEFIPKDESSNFLKVKKEINNLTKKKEKKLEHFKNTKGTSTVEDKNSAAIKRIEEDSKTKLQCCCGLISTALLCSALCFDWNDFFPNK
ncbi:hypothetical protein KAH94_01005 [bacterium]|nr:hypothetical protein [bacterium]